MIAVHHCHGLLAAFAQIADRAVALHRSSRRSRSRPISPHGRHRQFRSRAARSRRRGPRRTASRRPSMLRAAVWPWRSATTKCSTRIASPLCGSGQRAMSPAANTCWRAGLEELVDQHSAVDGEPGLFGERRRRTDADSDDDEVGVDALAIVQRHCMLVDRDCGPAEMERHAMQFVDRADERSKLRRPAPAPSGSPPGRRHGSRGRARGATKRLRGR